MLHHNFSVAPGVTELFNGTINFEEFIDKLNALAIDLPKDLPRQYGPNTVYDNQQRPILSDKDRYKILGDGFELFIEILIATTGADPHIGIGKYKPFGQEDGEDDQGIDGFGMNMKGERTAIQCKFTNDPTYEFTANGSNLGNFLIEAAFEGLLKKGQVYLFTTAKGINYATAKKWRYTVIEFTRKDIAALVDNNSVFWKAGYDLLSV